MAPRTIFLAKLIGLFTIVFALAMLAHRQETITTVTSLAQDSGSLLIFGAIALTAGIAMVLGHNIWTGGALPVAVTVIGWIILLRGALLTFLPAAIVADMFAQLRFGQRFYVYDGLMLALGGYLAAAGFLARPAPEA